jgi:hypothetical protein
VITSSSFSSNIILRNLWYPQLISQYFSWQGFPFWLLKFCNFITFHRPVTVHIDSAPLRPKFRSSF